MISFQLNQVKLTDEVFATRQALVKEYILNFDVDRLMHTFKVNAGIKSSAEPLGGWEGPECTLRGHFVGHFLAACAKFYYGTGNSLFKIKAEQIIDIMEQCARPNGYLSAFEEIALDNLEENENTGVWAPYYTLHKILNGLVCCAKFANSKKALALAENLALYIYDRFQKLSFWKIDSILRCVKTNPVNEFGGIGDALYTLYELDNNEKIFALAKIFDRDYFIGNLARNNDILLDLHANTHLPLVIAAMHRYSITHEENYKKAGINFYKFIKPRTFANGNSSSRAIHFVKGQVSENSEHWGEPQLTSRDITGGESESCCAHNTENLLGYLIQYDQDNQRNYLNHLECLKYNAVLNCASSKTGLSQYHQPMGKDKIKRFSTPYNDFWCCTASGVEAMSELQKNVWFSDDKMILLNMFVSSVLSLDHETKLTLVSYYPKKNKATIKISTRNSRNLKIAFKNNSILSAKINDKTYTLIKDGSFLVIDYTFNNNDIISLEVNSEIRIVPLASSENVYCVMYGNILLAKIDGEVIENPVLLKTGKGEFVGNGYKFIPLYMVENETYTVYLNSDTSKEAKDGSSAYK